MFGVNEASDALKSERKTGELMPLSKNFYLEVQTSLNSITEANERNSMQKLINSIKEKRTQKILIYLAYDKPLPRPIPVEDEDLYIQIKKMLGSSSPERNVIKVKITKKVPQILTPSGNSVGPFEQNETVFLEETSDIKFIVDNKLGEVIE